MSLKIVVDYDLCEANLVCMKLVPEVFKVDQDDKLHLLVDTPPAELMEKVELAVRRCPRKALSLKAG
jgi:ferredoxin